MDFTLDGVEFVTGNATSTASNGQPYLTLVVAGTQQGDAERAFRLALGNALKDAKKVEWRVAPYYDDSMRHGEHHAYRVRYAILETK